MGRAFFSYTGRIAEGGKFNRPECNAATRHTLEFNCNISTQYQVFHIKAYLKQGATTNKYRYINKAMLDCLSPHLHDIPKNKKRVGNKRSFKEKF